jgi:23S rRNA pseudouridine2604 synthase
MSGSDPEKSAPEGIRLNKYIASSGICSRREADKLIESGKVSVNGVVADLGTRVSEGDSVEVEGRSVTPEDSMIYIAFNKPLGITCTTDRRDPSNIIDYINFSERIFPIGRLDKNSSGLILLTNNGDIVNTLLRSENGHEKEYVVTTDKALTREFLDKLADGVYIKELNVTTRPCEVWQDMTLAPKVRQHEFHIVITQGLNRQIRRMCAAYGYKVKKLKRIRIMDLTLRGLKPGQYREIELSDLTDDIENL